MPKKQQRQENKKTKNIQHRSLKNSKKNKKSTVDDEFDHYSPRNSKIQEPPAFHSFVQEIPVSQNFCMNQYDNATTGQLNSLSRRAQYDPPQHILIINSTQNLQSVQQPQRREIEDQPIQPEAESIPNNSQNQNPTFSFVFDGNTDSEQKIMPLWQQKASFVKKQHDHFLNLIEMYFNQLGDYVSSRDRVHLLRFVIQDIMKSNKVLNHLCNLNSILQNYANSSYNSCFEKLQNTGVFRKTIGNRAIRFEAEYYSFRNMLKKRKIPIDQSYCIYCLVLSKVHYIQQESYRKIQEWGNHINILPQILEEWQTQKEKFYQNTNQLRYKFKFMEHHYFSISVEKKIYGYQGYLAEGRNQNTNQQRKQQNSLRFSSNKILVKSKDGRVQKRVENNYEDSQEEMLEQMCALIHESSQNLAQDRLDRGKRTRCQYK